MIPRQLFQEEHVQDVEDATVLCKYMPYTPSFCSLVELESLYLSNLTRFKDSDPLEGVTSLVERNATRHSELQKWYDSNKNYTFVTCFVLSYSQYDYMLREYAGGDTQDGLMLKTTVGRLKAELSRPPYRGPSLPSDAHPWDAFTVGVVEYFDDKNVELYPEMCVQPSNTRHVFRKRKAPFEKEKEYRVMLRPGSRSSENSCAGGPTHCFIRVDLAKLISEIRLKPGSSEAFFKNIRTLLEDNGLDSIPLLPSNIGVVGP